LLGAGSSLSEMAGLRGVRQFPVTSRCEMAWVVLTPSDSDSVDPHTTTAPKPTGQEVELLPGRARGDRPAVLRAIPEPLQGPQGYGSGASTYICPAASPGEIEPMPGSPHPSPDSASESRCSGCRSCRAAIAHSTTRESRPCGDHAPRSSLHRLPVLGPAGHELTGRARERAAWPCTVISGPRASLIPGSLGWTEPSSSSACRLPNIVSPRRSACISSGDRDGSRARDKAGSVVLGSLDPSPRPWCIGDRSFVSDGIGHLARVP
jgi:hypothetical protein